MQRNAKKQGEIKMFHVSREKKTKTGQTKINKQKRAWLDPSQCDLRFKYSLV